MKNKNKGKNIIDNINKSQARVSEKFPSNEVIESPNNTINKTNNMKNDNRNKLHLQKIDTQVPNVLLTESGSVKVDKVEYEYVEREEIKYIEETVTKNVPTWNISPVPRPIMNYNDDDNAVTIEKPEIKFNDVEKSIEKVVGYKDTFKVKKEIIQEEYSVTDYQWKKEEKEVPLYNIIPTVDVDIKYTDPVLLPDKTQQHDIFILQGKNEAKEFYKDYLKGKHSNEVYDNDKNNSYDDDNNNDGKSRTDTKCKESKLNILFNKLWSFFDILSCAGPRENNSDIKHRIVWEYPEGINDNDPNNHDNNNNLKNNDKTSHIIKNNNNNTNKFSFNKVKDLVEKSPIKTKLSNPITGEDLSTISFKLHAIEVHQYIPMPGEEIPEFLNHLPNEIKHGKLHTDGNTNINTICGIPAPIIGDLAYKM